MLFIPTLLVLWLSYQDIDGKAETTQFHLHLCTQQKHLVSVIIFFVPLPSLLALMYFHWKSFDKLLVLMLPVCSFSCWLRLSYQIWDMKTPVPIIHWKTTITVSVPMSASLTNSANIQTGVLPVDKTDIITHTIHVSTTTLWREPLKKSIWIDTKAVWRIHLWKHLLHHLR